MTSQPGRDVAHELPVGWVDRIRREVRDIAYAWADPLTRRGTLGSILILLGSFGPQTLPPDNVWRDVPVLGWFQAAGVGGRIGPGFFVGPAIMFTGVIILLDVWLRLRPSPERRPLSRGSVWWWSAPMMLAPPLLSFDAYSYAAQGRMVHLGYDPYDNGPAVLGDVYAAQVDPLWQTTAAPYGPLSLQIQHLFVDISQLIARVLDWPTGAYLAPILMRIPAFVGMLLIAIFLPRLARLLGYDWETTIWLAVLNPLVLLHFVGGAHNDSLMVGLMILALWLAATRHLVVGALCVAAAASIKQPAAAAVLAVAALHTWRSKGWTRPTNRELVWPVIYAGLVFVAGFVAIGLATRLGFGWIAALGVPGSVRAMLSPLTLIGTGLEWVLNQLGLHDTAGAVVPLLGKLGTLAGLGVMAWLVWRYKAKHPTRTLGWMLLAFVLTSPTVLAWYILWGGVIFAMTETGRVGRRVVVWTTCGLVIYSVVDAATRNFAIAVGVFAAIAMLWITTGHDRDLIREQVAARPPGQDRTD
ncbi:MAG TPA: polyprenol phosphomannose-dependent alpha 1,6 mannosyltransferase MptB [Dermatophilaceae bacterium]|nr:polyprenol phosphomannose-dependent alpha 1,6 mannosyltransferase MptB [Dermatophilaceae bacterium]